MRGFERAAGLIQSQIRSAGETRGFAEARLLTHWAEIVGQDIATMSRPVKISYARGGFGATLVLLTTGANAPLLQAESQRIRERVNACYGYNAISHIRVTQTAPTGFADGQVAFAEKPATPAAREPGALAKGKAHEAASRITDKSLAEALERLGQNVLSKAKPE